MYQHIAVLSQCKEGEATTQFSIDVWLGVHHVRCLANCVSNKYVSHTVDQIRGMRSSQAGARHEYADKMLATAVPTHNTGFVALVGQGKHSLSLSLSATFPQMDGDV